MLLGAPTSCRATKVRSLSSRSTDFFSLFFHYDVLLNRKLFLVNERLESWAMASSKSSFCICTMLVAFALGCGQKAVDPNRTMVSGTVTYDGKPLPAGNVSFESSEKGIATSVQIKDGSYSTDRAPVGTVAVGVDTASIQYGNPAKFVPIPAKYADSATSGLSIEIKPGDNPNVNFDLKP